MPTITTKKQPIGLKNHKWIAVINEFIINGRVASKAYEKAYPDCKTAFQTSSRLFKNAKFVVMLNKRLEQVSLKNDIQVGLLEEMYRRGYEVAEGQNSGAGMAQNVTGIARLYGKDRDNNIKDAVQIIITPPNSPKRVESETIENE